jgi:hypothetical protein
MCFLRALFVTASNKASILSALSKSTKLLQRRIDKLQSAFKAHAVQTKSSIQNTEATLLADAVIDRNIIDSSVSACLTDVKV